MGVRARHGAASHAAGRRDVAQKLFADAERRQREWNRTFLSLFVQGYLYCDLLLGRCNWVEVRERVAQSCKVAKRNRWLLDIALDEVSLGRATLGLALSGCGTADHADAGQAAGATCGCLTAP